MNNKYVTVRKWAMFKGRRVRLQTKDDRYYRASYLVDNHRADDPMDWMIDMFSPGKGEYSGRIAVDDPELQIEEE